MIHFFHRLIQNYTARTLFTVLINVFNLIPLGHAKLFYKATTTHLPLLYFINHFYFLPLLRITLKLLIIHKFILPYYDESSIKTLQRNKLQFPACLRNFNESINATSKIRFNNKTLPTNTKHNRNHHPHISHPLYNIWYLWFVDNTVVTNSPTSRRHILY